MNNQDKAEEIAKDLELCNLDKESAWQGAMNMAEWKDANPSDELIDTIASIAMNYTEVIYNDAMLETIRHLVKMKEQFQ